MTERGRTLRVAVAQPQTVLGDIENNAAAHAEAIRRCATRLVVFPELSLTGYSMDAAVVHSDDPALALIVAACGDTGGVALVGAAVRHGDGRAIGVLAVDGDGARVVYRKMSLGGDEVTTFSAGVTPGVVEVDGWRVGVGVCKDTRIDAHLEATAAAGVDVYAAGLVHAPAELHDLEKRAQRITHRYGVPVVFAACAGPTGGGYVQTSGGSAIWDRDGHCMARAGATPGERVEAELRA